MLKTSVIESYPGVKFNLKIWRFYTYSQQNDGPFFAKFALSAVYLAVIFFIFWLSSICVCISG